MARAPIFLAAVLAACGGGSGSDPDAGVVLIDAGEPDADVSCPGTQTRCDGECVETSSIEERTDQGLMTEKVRVELRRFFKRRSGRRPLVLPVLMEI